MQQAEFINTTPNTIYERGTLICWATAGAQNPLPLRLRGIRHAAHVQNIVFWFCFPDFVRTEPVSALGVSMDSPRVGSGANGLSMLPFLSTSNSCTRGEFAGEREFAGDHGSSSGSRCFGSGSGSGSHCFGYGSGSGSGSIDQEGVAKGAMALRLRQRSSSTAPV